MIAIIDCNSFYCACEKVFRPDLKGKPVVVLSNNDGCIVSRSDEAKKLGVAMAGPYFQAKPLIELNHVAVFSSNYHLYGDMSWRVMETIRTFFGRENVEVYSVDEAFADMYAIPTDQIRSASLDIKSNIEQWTGIAVSIGVAPTKVLSKVANRIAKKNKSATGCLMILDSETAINEALERTAVEDIWGVGFQYTKKLRQLNINTAYDLKQMNTAWASKHLGGVTGVRLIKELNGESAIVMEKELVNKKMIATTRMFGEPINCLKDIREAIASYTSRAAEKLRRQHSAASGISVFIVPKEPVTISHFHHGPTVSSFVQLPVATSATHELIKPALRLAEKLFEDGTSYKKAGVVLSGIIPDHAVQGNLFQQETNNHHRSIMTMMDNINFSMRNDIVKFAAAGTKKDWKMRQELRSNRFTTRWEELYLLQ